LPRTKQICGSGRKKHANGHMQHSEKLVVPSPHTGGDTVGTKSQGGVRKPDDTRHQQFPVFGREHRFPERRFYRRRPRFRAFRPVASILLLARPCPTYLVAALNAARKRKRGHRFLPVNAPTPNRRGPPNATSERTRGRDKPSRQRAGLPTARALP
jgi:hypothetical protein